MKTAEDKRMNRDELLEKLEEIMDRNYQNFKGTNEAELMIREEIADLFKDELLKSRAVQLPTIHLGEPFKLGAKTFVATSDHNGHNVAFSEVDGGCDNEVVYCSCNGANACGFEPGENGRLRCAACGGFAT